MESERVEEIVDGLGRGVRHRGTGDHALQDVDSLLGEVLRVLAIAREAHDVAEQDRRLPSVSRAAGTSATRRP